MYIYSCTHRMKSKAKLSNINNFILAYLYFISIWSDHVLPAYPGYIPVCSFVQEQQRNKSKNLK